MNIDDNRLMTNTLEMRKPLSFPYIYIYTWLFYMKKGYFDLL